MNTNCIEMEKQLVVQCFIHYLGLTENWIYSHVSDLKSFRSMAVCLYKNNLNAYPMSEILCAQDFFPKRMYGIYDFIVRKNPGLLINIIRRKTLGKGKILHAHFGNVGYWFLTMRRRLKIPLITTFYGFDALRLPKIDSKWRYRYYRLFQEGDLFLVEGQSMKRTLMGLGCDEKKLAVFHLGADLEKIHYRKREQNKEILKLLVVGRFTEKKGITYAIKTLNNLRKMGKKVEMTIVGDASNPIESKREKQKIESLIREYNLFNVVSLVGFQPFESYLDQLYKSDILIAPSVTAEDGDGEGGLPVAVIEALASGMPVIATNHCDIPEAVLDGYNGFLVPEKDVNGMVEKAAFFIDNPNQLTTFGANGRKYVEDNYSLARQRIYLNSIYEKVIC